VRSSVIIFPGSNCDRDTDVALKKLNFKNSMVWHNETELPKSDLVILPGGFSYGDYLRTGCIAAKSNIIHQVIEFAKKGGLVLGICNGFQILIETGLLVGTLMRNKNLNFIFEKEIIELHIAHNDGNYYVNSGNLKKLEDNNQIAFKYCDKFGNISNESNPNGSIKNIAAVYNKKQNILGMMPHPERMIDKYLSGEDGNLLLTNLFSKHS
jgi:phosphoribosylformylglycinamidine synthase